ncbi:MAG: MerR family transcriptional regulator [Bauldia sp.]
MTLRTISIGEAAGRTGVKVPTIRYYEQVGLLPAAGRTAANHRHYSADELRRLSFIRQARELGFSVPSIRELLELKDKPDHPCSDAHRIARLRLNEVTRRIESLLKLRSTLEAIVSSCNRERGGACGVIEALAEARP